LGDIVPTQKIGVDPHDGKGKRKSGGAVYPHSKRGPGRMAGTSFEVMLGRFVGKKS
jgi:hypothetical protein